MIEDRTDLRDLSAVSAEQVLALNNAHAAELSWLEPEKLRSMIAEAYFARAIGDADAFMVVFDENADYGSPNFLWFRERYPRFAYVDRVVVAPHARGRGLARRLYEELFRKAASDGHSMIVCEVNAEPPNPTSDAFHTALGFTVIGSAEVYGGERTVRYYARML